METQELLKVKGLLFLAVFLIGFPILIYYLLSYIFSPSPLLCWASLPSGFLLYLLWLRFGSLIKKPTEKTIELGESERAKERTKKPSFKKSSTSVDSKKKDRGIFSSLFGGKDKCEVCGTKLVYKEGAGSYYCPECQEYKWK